MKSPRHLSKRTLLMVLLLLICGAIINVAVAWGCASLSRWPQNSNEILSEQTGTHFWPVSIPTHWPAMPKMLVGKGTFWTIDRYFGRRYEFADNNRILKTEAFLIDQYLLGFPLRSLRSESWSEFVIEGQPATTTNRFEGHPEPSIWRDGIPTQWGFEVLPLWPIWLGFAINTIFYAVILWLLFAAPGFARRRIRIHRKQCPACAYPIGASEICTECGRLVRQMT